MEEERASRANNMPHAHRKDTARAYARGRVREVGGDAVTTPDGSTVIPISKVSFGFVAGGGEYSLPASTLPEAPFAGGTGAGVSVQPMGFLVISQNQVRLAPAQYVAPLDHLMELVPQLIGEVRRLFPAKQPAQ